MAVFPHAARDQDVVLEILSHARQMLPALDAMSLQFAFIADARQHQDLGRVDGAEAEDDFAVRPCMMQFAIEEELHPDRPGARELQALHRRLQRHGEVRLSHDGAQVRAGHRDSFMSSLDRDIRDAAISRSLHGRAVQIVDRRDAGLLRRHHQRGGQRDGIARFRDVNRAVGAAPLRIGRPIPLLDATIDIENGLVAPARVAGLLGPCVKIVLVPACPDEPVDARATAQNSAHGQGRTAARERGARLGLELPVACAADVAHPVGGIAHRIDLIVAASLEQQHRGVGMFGEAPRHHATGRAAAADDEVIGASNRVHLRPDHVRQDSDWARLAPSHG